MGIIEWGIIALILFLIWLFYVLTRDRIKNNADVPIGEQYY